MKILGDGEWDSHKHKTSSRRRSWRKLHIAVDDEHIIHGDLLTDRFTSDDSAIEPLIIQIDNDVAQIIADGAYDKSPVYAKLSSQFADAKIIIPPDSDAVYNKTSHSQRNRNLQEIKTFGRIDFSYTNFRKFALFTQHAILTVKSSIDQYIMYYHHLLSFWSVRMRIRCFDWLRARAV